MENTLRKLIEFSKKSGETLIITDVSGEDPFVVLPLNRYQELISAGKTTEDSARSDAEPVLEPAKIIPDHPAFKAVINKEIVQEEEKLGEKYYFEAIDDLSEPEEIPPEMVGKTQDS